MDRTTGGQASESGVQPWLLPRREFLKGLSLLGALAFLSPFLPGCFSGDTTSKEVPMGKVSLIKTTDRA